MVDAQEEEAAEVVDQVPVQALEAAEVVDQAPVRVRVRVLVLDRPSSTEQMDKLTAGVLLSEVGRFF